MPGTPDDWDLTCEVLARKSLKRAKAQTPLPADEWDASSREMERQGEYGPDEYFPSDPAVWVVSVLGGNAFSHETQKQAGWREASNRMKRAGDLWKKHADDVADIWGRWCIARAINLAGVRTLKKDRKGELHARTKR
jgi:hypothetical protein